ncbi:MAG: AbrB/MazE/SpoVT family DNA-binding domain-containing protein [Candidatus Omnitrophica bacterium]|jgi:bifunctional DNA-binding transcriptional regulator/antitoxin component of YhaV-PrlF toxin-antitoxin module|nr:AbrB/MazE/SpoVT family DNA-binding domain-containing protein [Candidatus Omnitrophota bacterium]
MAQHKKKGGVTRKITKTGDYTYYVTIPAEYIEELGWRCKQKVLVKLLGKKVVIEDWRG